MTHDKFCAVRLRSLTSSMQIDWACSCDYIQKIRDDECRILNETKVYIVEPVHENLLRYKLLGWYLPGQAVTDFHSDGTITLDGKVHWYGSGERA